MTRLCALLTCFNRRDTTLACLEALFRCDLPADTSLAVVLVDDGSQDGTGDAVLERFPAVRVIRGNGSLYWNGGMRLAYLATIELPFDDYLWLNDDTMLDPQALSTLWACREQCSTRSHHACDGAKVGTSTTA